MNDIINWIAVNNTLMIRIGFTAILVLLVVYVFRFFFLPKINMIAEANEVKLKVPKPSATSSSPKKEEDIEDLIENAVSESAEATSSASKAASAVVSPEKATEAAVAPAVDTEELNKKNEEIQKLKDENAKLKSEVGSAQTKITELEKNLTNAKADATAAALATTAPISGSAAPADPETVTGLNKKIEQLESRLAEYEIIAEEISEIGDLRKENAALKKQLEELNSRDGVADVPLAAANTSEELAPAEEVQAEVVGLEDSIGSALDDFHTSQNADDADAKKSTEEEPATSEASAEITAEAKKADDSAVEIDPIAAAMEEVSITEKALLEQFETNKKKESS